MKYLLLAAAVAAISASSPAIGQSMPLNTGYNYTNNSLYFQPPGGTSIFSDNYWIKVASYEPPATTMAVAPAWVLPATPPPPWAAPLTVTIGSATISSRWIGPRQVAASPTGSNAQNPAYSIFKKCFCLMPGYLSPQLSFRVRADDNVQVWLNSITNTLVGPVNGSFGGPPRTGGTSNPAHFQTWRNCLYVLVEDNLGGQMGFNLAGSVSAIGLMPMAGAGINFSFAPCQCGPGPGPTGTAASTNLAGRARTADADDDSATVRAIVAYAEGRRRSRAAR